MRTKLLLGLALVLCGKLVVAQPSDTSPDGRKWGEVAGGFQMAVSLDESNGIIHCWIRNATTNALDFPISSLGFEGLDSIEVQVGTNWLRIGGPLFPQGNIPDNTDAGREIKLERIKPGDTITNTPPEWAEVQKQFGDSETPPHVLGYWDENTLRLFNFDPNRPNQKFGFDWFEIRVPQRTILLKKECRLDTYAYDLFIRSPFLDALTNESFLKARVEHDFTDYRRTASQLLESESNVTLYSPIFIIGGASIRNSIVQEKNLWELYKVGGLEYYEAETREIYALLKKARVNLLEHKLKIVMEDDGRAREFNPRLTAEDNVRLLALLRDIEESESDGWSAVPRQLAESVLQESSEFGGREHGRHFEVLTAIANRPDQTDYSKHVAAAALAEATAALQPPGPIDPATGLPWTNAPATSLPVPDIKP